MKATANYYYLRCSNADNYISREQLQLIMSFKIERLRNEYTLRMYEASSQPKYQFCFRTLEAARKEMGDLIAWIEQDPYEPGGIKYINAKRHFQL